MNIDMIMVVLINIFNGDILIFQIFCNIVRMLFLFDLLLYRDFFNGFVGKDGDGNNFDYMVNEIWLMVKVCYVDCMGVIDYFGVDVFKLVIGEVFGFKIDYFVMFDIDGFQKFIDVFGGVLVNINECLFIVGNIEGKRLDGYFEIGVN